MGKLATLGGKAVTKSLIGKGTLISRADLERKYLLQCYDSGVWDDRPAKDKPNYKSMGLRFEREWAKFCKSKYCMPVTNGTHALQLALEVLDIGAGDEVIVPGLTWQATAAAVCDVNAVPILVDVELDTMCIDPAAIERAITPKTRAIIPVHLFHRMADMDKIMRIARKHKLAVIEDCAHAHGSQWAGRGAGTIGDAGCYSFQMSKLMTPGEGGAVLVQKAKLYWLLRSLRTCGRAVKPGLAIQSGNFRLSSLSCAILLGQLAAYRKNAVTIDRNGKALDKAVAAAPGVTPLRRDKKITRQCSYCYGFIYNPDEFDGLDVKVFREALSAELGVNFGGTYEPLNNTALYQPHLKKRHQLSKSYVKAITPGRFKLPVAESLFAERGVTSSWHIQATAPARAKYLTDAITKVYENRKELLTKNRK